MVHEAFLALRASTVHLVIEEFPSKPGVNWRTAEKASILETASLVGETVLAAVKEVGI